MQHTSLSNESLALGLFPVGVGNDRRRVAPRPAVPAHRSPAGILARDVEQSEDRSLFPFFARWREHRERVQCDAATLVTEHGPLAYDVARRMARAERSGQLISPSLPRGHWEKVRRAVKRSEGRL